MKLILTYLKFLLYYVNNFIFVLLQTILYIYIFENGMFFNLMFLSYTNLINKETQRVKCSQYPYSIRH